MENNFLIHTSGCQTKPGPLATNWQEIAGCGSVFSRFYKEPPHVLPFEQFTKYFSRELFWGGI
jgi:hypothetical protein